MDSALERIRIFLGRFSALRDSERTGCRLAGGTFNVHLSLIGHLGHAVPVVTRNSFTFFSNVLNLQMARCPAGHRYSSSLAI